MIVIKTEKTLYSFDQKCITLYRPPTRKELEQFGQDAMCVSFPNPGEVKVYNEKNREKVWEFDEVQNFDEIILLIGLFYQCNQNKPRYMMLNDYHIKIYLVL